MVPLSFAYIAQIVGLEADWLEQKCGRDVRFPTFRIAGYNFKVVYVGADIIVAVLFLARADPHIPIVPGRSESERSKKISKWCPKSSTRWSKTIECFLENEQTPFAIAKLQTSIVMNFHHAIGGDKCISDIPAQNRQIVSMRDKIEGSDANSPHNCRSGVDTHRVNHVSPSNQAGLTPAILFNLAYHGKFSPLILVRAGFVGRMEWKAV